MEVLRTLTLLGQAQRTEATDGAPSTLQLSWHSSSKLTGLQLPTGNKPARGLGLAIKVQGVDFLQNI